MDGDGKLSTTELSRLCHAMGSKLTHSELEAAIATLDVRPCAKACRCGGSDGLTDTVMSRLALCARHQVNRDGYIQEEVGG